MKEKEGKWRQERVEHRTQHLSSLRFCPCPRSLSPSRGKNFEIEDSNGDIVGDIAAPTHILSSCRISSVSRILTMLRSANLDLNLQAAKKMRRMTKASRRRHFSAATEHLVGANMAALAALLNLAVQDEAVVNAGSMKPLMNLLLSGNLAVEEIAVSVMITLSASPINKPIMGASGVIPLLVQILWHGVPQAKSDALMVLYNLSSHQENLTEILRTEPIPPLVNVLKSTRKSSKTAGTCTALVEILMGFEEARTALTAEQGGILAVVEVLESRSPRNRGYAVGALLTLCQSDRSKYREPILGEGVIPGLLELTVQGTPKSRAKAQLLLRLLRETPCPASDLQPDAFQHILCDIVSQIDMEELCCRPKEIFSEMVRMSMELSLKRMQNHALALASSDL